MFFIDTHAHLYLSKFDEDRNEMIARAIEAGVTKMLLPNIDVATVEPMHDLCDAFPNNCFPMMGLHPCDVKTDFENTLKEMFTYFGNRKYVAVGETGIDLFWDKTTLNIQKQAFAIQINWAKDLQLPIVIHARDSFDEIFDVLDRMNDDKLRGVFHCFTGTEVQARKIMDYGGFMMGLGGVLTYEKSGLDATIKDIPMEYFVLETDAPFLAPKPHRGKRNESAFVRFVAERMANIYDVELAEIMRITTGNAYKLFNLLESENKG